MVPRKPPPFTLDGEAVADCFVDCGQIVTKGRKLIVVDAVFHLVDAQECERALSHLESVVSMEGPGTIAAIVLETGRGELGNALILGLVLLTLAFIVIVQIIELTILQPMQARVNNWRR